MSIELITCNERLSSKRYSTKMAIRSEDRNIQRGVGSAQTNVIVDKHRKHRTGRGTELHRLMTVV